VADADPYLDHRDVIERAIRFVCRRHRLAGPDADDLASTVRLHLLADDAAVLRAFTGRSSFRTYLITVVTHQFQDWRNAQWGKWRPSAEARRMGPLGVLLETRLARDGLSMDQAVEMLRTNHGVTEPRSALEAMVTRFPSRVARTFVDDRMIADHAAVDGQADTPMLAEASARTARRAASVLEAALRALPSQDRIILSMRFDDDLSIASIAQLLGLEQKPLYRRVVRLLLGLRSTLEAEGIGASDAADVLEHRGFDLAAGSGTGESGFPVRLFNRRPGSPVSGRKVS
jgi:RNA polymerase sigma factor (sigma-70 family)